MISNFNKNLTLTRYVFSKCFSIQNITGLKINVKCKPDMLKDAMNIFLKNNVNITHISSKPPLFQTEQDKEVSVFVDMEGKETDKHIQSAVLELKLIYDNVAFSKIEQMPWFPQSRKDLNQFGNNFRAVDNQIKPNHVGSTDPEFLKRREEIIRITSNSKISDTICVPEIKYTEEENETWEAAFKILKPLYDKHATKEFNDSIQALLAEGAIKVNEVPQIKTISEFLNKKSNFLFRPVGGKLTVREFLNSLAFRVFTCKQYIRHSSQPIYTDSPDIIHEVLGHVPMLANKDFADIIQLIGIGSLGASDEGLNKLANIFWHIAENGVTTQNGERKVYGGANTNSVVEMEYNLSEEIEVCPFDIEKMAMQSYDIYEDTYKVFLTPELLVLKKELEDYVVKLAKPFNLTYNTRINTVKIDRSIEFRKETIIDESKTY